MNSTITNIFTNINYEKIGNIEANLLKNYFLGVLNNPYIYIGITFGVITIIILFLKQMLDNSETSFQNLLFKTFLRLTIFLGTLLILILADAGELMILYNNIKGGIL